MTTLADLQARVRRLEQRKAPRWAGLPQPTPTPAQARTLLAMLIEAGAFAQPREDSPLWRLCEWLRSQPDYGQEDDSNSTPDAGTSDPAGPIFDAAQPVGV